MDFTTTFQIIWLVGTCITTLVAIVNYTWKDSEYGDSHLQIFVLGTIWPLLLCFIISMAVFVYPFTLLRRVVQHFKHRSKSWLS
jgi:hypothetical protein